MLPAVGARRDIAEAGAEERRRRLAPLLKRPVLLVGHWRGRAGAAGQQEVRGGNGRGTVRPPPPLTPSSSRAPRPARLLPHTVDLLVQNLEPVHVYYRGHFRRGKLCESCGGVWSTPGSCCRDIGILSNSPQSARTPSSGTTWDFPPQGASCQRARLQAYSSAPPGVFDCPYLLQALLGTATWSRGPAQPSPAPAAPSRAMRALLVAVVAAGELQAGAG